MRMRGTAEERSASIIPDGIAECTSGYLTKQGGKYKSWRKRYFVLTGLKLRWYEKKEAFDAHGLHAARGEITCFAVCAAIRPNSIGGSGCRKNSPTASGGESLAPSSALI